MKKILYKKILSDYLIFFLISILSTSIIIWVFQAVNYLDIMIEDGRSYLVYIKFSLLSLPKIFSKILPFMLFFSVYYITLRYEINNELLIMWNFGVHKIQIINYFFAVSIILMIVQIIFTTLIVPKGQDLARSFLRTSQVNFLDNFIKPQKFIDTIKGVTIYTEKKYKNGDFKNIYLKRGIGNNYQITYAKRGKFEYINNKPELILFDGATITLKDKELTNFSFSKSNFSLQNFETNTTTYIKTQELSSLKIIKCLLYYYKLDVKNFLIKSKSIENCRLGNMNNILKELYKRFIVPFYIPLLSLVPFLLILTSKENPNYQNYKIGTFLVGLLLLISSETTIRLISDKIILNLIIISLPVLILLIFYLFLSSKFKKKIRVI
ncbi:LptF/LptG family permease [Candidatus Pelagibacter sp. HIMB1493]|uniref:LptF/LptG family permease n=1 Tax=Candidatus Pelagibacter sp. HIMB1493 TaxID=3413334 RepID=UPI003F857382